MALFCLCPVARRRIWRDSLLVLARSPVIVFAFAFALALNSARAETHVFQIDPARTVVQFETSQFFIKIAGRFHDVTGTLRIDAEHPEDSSVTATCPTRTIDTANATRDDHLRSELFEVQKFPQASFRSRKVARTARDQADVTGDLTLHGVTQPILLHVTLVGRSKGQHGELSRWQAVSEPFSRRAFGLVWPRGTEMIAGVSDRATLRIDCEARE
jgi:polyisoprenoid-binding protein YceI